VAELLPQARQHEAVFRRGLKLHFDGQSAGLRLLDLQIPEVEDTRLPRLATLRYRGAVAADASTVTWQYAAEFGNSVVRFAGSGGRHHPIVGAWNVSLVKDLWALIAGGERKIDRAADALGGYAVKTWPLDPLRGDPFFNINTRADLDQATALYRASSASI